LSILVSNMSSLTREYLADLYLEIVGIINL
jgi:hypothetical protein